MLHQLWRWGTAGMGGRVFGTARAHPEIFLGHCRNIIIIIINIKKYLKFTIYICHKHE
jgi:hypothetical protein